MPTETANWVGQVLSGGRYQVTAKLGEGGMAFVFRAADRHLGCEVVVKVPRPALLQEPEFAGRFAREVRSLVRLAHPHIVKLSDVGTHEGIPFAVMQYLPGGSLRDRLQPGPDGVGRPRPPSELRGWLGDVAAALDFMHQEGYLHRDVKPDNILFDQHGHVFLSDFGIAKALAGVETDRAQQTVLTNAGMVLGTAPYMAPEILLGQAYDGRADQYALAVTVYQVLSGTLPFDGLTPAAIVMQQAAKTALPLHERLPGLPKALAAVVHKGLHRDPCQRFPTCQPFADAALAAAQGQPLTVLPVEPKAPPRAAAAAPVQALMACPRCHKKFGVPPTVKGQRICCPFCKAVSRPPDSSQVRQPARKRSEPAHAETAIDQRSSQTAPTPQPRPKRIQAQAAPRQRWSSGAKVAAWLLGLVALQATALGIWWLLTRSPSQDPSPAPPPAAGAKQPRKREVYTIRFKTPALGETHRVAKAELTTGQVKVPGRDGQPLPDQDFKEGSQSLYTETILETEPGAPRPRRLNRQYDMVTVTGKVGTRALSYQAKTVLIEKQGDRYAFHLESGEALAGEDTRQLGNEFNNKNELADATLMERLLPTDKAVEVGETWKIEAAAINKLFQDQKAIQFIPEQTIATATLQKAYKQDGRQYGVLSVRLELSPKSLAATEGNTTSLQPGAKMAAEFTVDGCIDGSSANLSVTFRWTFQGEVRFAGANPPISRMEMKLKANGNYERRPEATAPEPARLTVLVPTAADVWFDGNQTAQKGSQREFLTPPLEPGRRYAYTIRARWAGNGTSVEESRSIKLRAGDRLTVNFTNP